MKITLEFKHPHELTALLVELASKIEQPEDTCKPYEPLSCVEMAQALGPAVNNDPVDADYIKLCQDGYERMKKMINENDSGVVKINKPARYPAMYTEQDETPISHDHTKAE